MAFHHIGPCNNCLVIYGLERAGSCASRTLHFPSSSHTQLNFWIVGTWFSCAQSKPAFWLILILNPEASLWVYVAWIRSLLHIAVAQTLGGKACFLSHWGQSWRTFFHSIFITPHLLLTILIKQIALGKAFNPSQEQEHTLEFACHDPGPFCLSVSSRYLNSVVTPAVPYLWSW